MNETLTFVESDIPLCKRITLDKVFAYPRVASLTSTTADVEISPQGLADKVAILRHMAQRGAAMMKGPLRKPLVNESRKGMSDRAAKTRTLILDFDKILLMHADLTTPLNQPRIVALAEQLIGYLPEYFRSVSYIIHASASLGRTKNRVGMHIEMWLKDECYPADLKDFITNLNFDCDFYKDQLDLTASGTALKYPIDRVLADNTRIVFIAPPIFEGVEDPIPDQDNRIIGVSKNETTLNLREQMDEINPGSIKNKATRALNSIRRVRGLSAHRPKTQKVKVDGYEHDVVTNPQQITMSVAYDNDDFVYYNINGGDSNAYYVRKSDPTIVFNFKDEPPFVFREADPEAYDWHAKEYPYVGKPGEDVSPVPLVFRDKNSDQYFNCLLDPSTQTFLEAKPTSKRQALGDYMSQYGGVMPDPLLAFDYVYDPQDERLVDIPGEFINKFRPTELWRAPPEIPEEFRLAAYDELYDKLEVLCPSIATLIMNACGGKRETNHFINWLSFIFQRRERTGTAWILHGTQGSGKGVLIWTILKPLFGDNVYKIENKDLKENYNLVLENHTLLWVDEFNEKEGGDGLMNKLKTYITEEEISIRAMYSNVYPVHNYCNFIFASNEYDLVSLPVDDRRFNVAVRQKEMLRHSHPELHANLRDRVEHEINDFAGFIACNIIHEEAVRTPLENLAKQQLREAGTTTIDDFIRAITFGKLDYFIPVLDIPLAVNNQAIAIGQQIVRRWLSGYEDGDEVKVTPQELLPLYNLLVGKMPEMAKLIKLLAHRGVSTGQMRIGGRNKRGYRIEFVCEENTRELLRSIYIKDNIPGLKEVERIK